MSQQVSMRSYVQEAPRVAYANIARAEELCAPLVSLCDGVRRLVVVASGSSHNAALCALPFMRRCVGDSLAVELTTPFTFGHYAPPLGARDLAVVVSQSGLSTNAIAALDAIRAQGRPAVCLTANPGSDIRLHADVVVDYGAGEELVGYVTKGVTTLAVFLCLLAAQLGAAPGAVEEIRRTVRASERTVALAPAFVDRHFAALSSLSCCYCCGAGGTWGVASEAALKVGETIHVPAVAYEVEEFIHGPNLQLTPAYTVLFFDAPDSARERTQQIYHAARAVTDRAYLVTTDARFKSDDNALVVDPSGDFAPELASIAYLPFPQLLCHAVNEALASSKQHPFLKRFKAIAAAKTDRFVNYDGDD